MKPRPVRAIADNDSDQRRRSDADGANERLRHRGHRRAITVSDRPGRLSRGCRPSAGRITPAPGGRHVRVRATRPRRSGAGCGGEKKYPCASSHSSAIERGELLLGLDALGGDAQPERVREADHRRDDRGVARDRCPSPLTNERSIFTESTGNRFR